jgi:hypothetical protein
MSIDNFLILLDLEQKLKRWDYDKLGLANLDRLRMEVHIMVEQEKLRDKIARENQKV